MPLNIMNTDTLLKISSNTQRYQQDIANQFSNWIDLLSYRAVSQSNQEAFTFLQNGETTLGSLTYQQLNLQAQAIASQLQSLKATGERALLLYPPGLEFISAFFGCLYAGLIAVPAYPPRRNQSIERLQAIIADSQATVALTTTSLLANIDKHLQNNPALAQVRWLATDNIPTHLASDWQQPIIQSDTLAFLQYTSGSTGAPKGVMVTHENLLHNEKMIQQGFQHTDKSIVVGWLPLFHDMGLIGNVLQPLYLGIPCILMSPVDFLQKPLRWLQAISNYQATTSGGPNFAYELCLNKITEEQKANIDLSSWQVAFTGAEPIRAETLDKFAQAFEPCGFRREAFYPCYGMAEATLFISGGIKTQSPIIQIVEESALTENQVIVASSEAESTRSLVGVGVPWLDQQIAIVDPESLTKCPVGQVGEIWVSGMNVAQGYWCRPEQTQETFQAVIANTGESPFLRTGDLGFLSEDGELFVTGRLKDVIIIRGRNHYPQDIELTVEQSHSALISNRSAAFSVEIDGDEKLVIVAEVERRYRERRQSSPQEKYDLVEQREAMRRSQESIDPGFEVELQQPLSMETVVGNIRQSVTAHHGLQVHAVLLLRVGSIPKTSSGKIQRYACRKGFLDGSLTVVY